MLKDLIKDTAGIRRPGSAALDLAYVPPAGWTAFGKSACCPGTWRPACC